MKMYAVAVAYEGIYSVFSTPELAKEYMATCLVARDAYILEIELDNPLHEVLVEG